MSSVPPSDRPETAYGAPSAYRGPAPAQQGHAAAPGWPGYAESPAPGGAPPPPGAWAQPPPGYAQAPYADPAYQPTTTWSGRGGREYRPRRPRRTGPSLVSVAPALFVSVVISVGIVVLFVANLFVALGEPDGTPGRQRLLQFLAPADLASAAALVLAVVLVVLQRQLPGDVAAINGPRGGRVRMIALLAGGVAAFVAFCAVVRGIVFLTVPHQSVAVNLGDFLGSLVAAAIAAGAAAWALRNRW